MNNLSFEAGVINAIITKALAMKAIFSRSYYFLVAFVLLSLSKHSLVSLSSLRQAQFIFIRACVFANVAIS